MSGADVASSASINPACRSRLTNALARRQPVGQALELVHELLLAIGSHARMVVADLALDRIVDEELEGLGFADGRRQCLAVDLVLDDLDDAFGKLLWVGVLVAIEKVLQFEPAVLALKERRRQHGEQHPRLVQRRLDFLVPRLALFDILDVTPEVHPLAQLRAQGQAQP